MKTRKRAPIFAVILALLLMMALPLTVHAATTITVDLADTNSSGTGYTYADNTFIVKVTDPDTTVYLFGDGTDKRVRIEIQSLSDGTITQVEIADNTKIIALAGSGQPALEVPGGTTIHGNGPGITITGGDAAFGVVEEAGVGISANGGDVTLTGTFGTIIGGSSTVGGGGAGISADGSVTIERGATVGAIKGGTGTSTVSNNVHGGHGIYAHAGNITIDGRVTGGITGGSATGAGGTGRGGHGIYAHAGNITIDGRVTGSITGGDNTDDSGDGGHGIYAEAGSVTIESGATVGAIKGGNSTGGSGGCGIFADAGNVTLMRNTASKTRGGIGLGGVAAPIKAGGIIYLDPPSGGDLPIFPEDSSGSGDHWASPTAPTPPVVVPEKQNPGMGG